MTESERIALNWVRQFLRGHHCPRCNSEWVTAASVTVLMHSCRGAQKNRGGAYDWRGARHRHVGERTEWARSLLGELSDAVEQRDGPDALLRGEGQ